MKHIAFVAALDRQAHGLRPGGDNQLVIGFAELLAGGQVLHRQRFGLGLDSQHPVAGKHIHIILLLKKRPIAGHQLFPRLNLRPDIIGQAAAGVGHILVGVKNTNLRIPRYCVWLWRPPKSRRPPRR
jgi:hypothetical protein